MNEKKFIILKNLKPIGSLQGIAVKPVIWKKIESKLNIVTEKHQGVPLSSLFNADLTNESSKTLTPEDKELGYLSKGSFSKKHKVLNKIVEEDPYKETFFDTGYRRSRNHQSGSESLGSTHNKDLVHLAPSPILPIRRTSVYSSMEKPK